MTERNSSERRDRMYALYCDGATLQEVGDRFGLTRERVRQVFSEAGLRTRTTSRSVAMQQERMAAERRDEICAAFLELRDIRGVARRLKVPQGVVRKIVEGTFSERELRRRGQGTPLYSDDELISFLRQAAKRFGGALSLGAYKQYAKGRRTGDGRRWPTAQTFSMRLGDGSWPKAVRAAGARPVSRGRRGKKAFNERQCIEAIVAAKRELGRVPTTEEYRIFAEASQGAFPSLATVRNRFRSWYDALDAAGL